jgi:hypothetical protein
MRMYDERIPVKIQPVSFNTGELEMQSLVLDASVVVK